MGKLMRKFIHRIVPSWLTKIKASDAASLSPKKLLPFLRGGSRRGFSSLQTSKITDNLTDYCCSSSDEEEPRVLMRQQHRRNPSLESESSIIDHSDQKGDDTCTIHHQSRGKHRQITSVDGKSPSLESESSVIDNSDEEEDAIAQHETSAKHVSCAHLQISEHGRQHIRCPRHAETSKERRHENEVEYGNCSCSGHHEDADDHDSEEDTSRYPEISSSSHREIITWSSHIRGDHRHHEIMHGHMRNGVDDGGGHSYNDIHRSQHNVYQKQQGRHPGHPRMMQIMADEEGRMQDEGGHRQPPNLQQRQDLHKNKGTVVHWRQHSTDSQVSETRHHHERRREQDFDGNFRAKRKRECVKGEKVRKRAKVASCRLPESICAVVGDGRAEVQYSQDAEMAFWESMVEMIVGNGLSGDMAALRFLLACYLCLNEPDLHATIHRSFFRVLEDLCIDLSLEEEDEEEV